MPRPSKATSLGPYILLETIGHGSFGKVKRAIHRDSRRVFAIKIMEKESILQSKVDTQVRKETMIMTTLDHPNVVKMYQAMTTISKVVIVMELVTGGELYHEILRHKRLTEDSARHYYRQLIEGLHHCHSHGVYHRDLKPENLLLDQNGCLKISDFGLSTLQLKHEDRCHTQCGTPNYVAPEVISRAIQGYDGAKVDVWSSGIVLYVLVAGELPFDDNDPTELFRKIVAGVFELPHWFSEPLRDLIPHLLDLEPETRYGLEQIRNHPWYTQVTPPAPPPLPIPAALPVTSSTIAAAAAETSASCASVAVATPRDREEDDALFPGMNFINPTFKPTDTPGNVHPDVKLSIGQQSDLSAFGAPPVAPVDAVTRLPVVASGPDAVLRSGAMPPLPPTTARRPRSRQSSYLSRFQSAEHLSDSGMNSTRPDAVLDVAHSDGEASMVEEEVTAYIAPDHLRPPPRLVTGATAVRHAPTAVRASVPSNGANVAAPIGAPLRSVRQDNIDRVAAELMAANDSAPLNEVPSALNAERMRRYLIQQQEQVLQQHHSSTDTDRSPLVGAAPALSDEGIRQLAVAREAAAVAVAASVMAAPSPVAHVPAPFVPTKVDSAETPYVPQVLPAAGSGVAELAFGVPSSPLAAVDPAVVAALDARPAQELDDVASSGANQFDDAPADSGELGDALASVSHDVIPPLQVPPPPSSIPITSPLVSTGIPAATAAVEHVDPDRGTVLPTMVGTASSAAPAVAPAAWNSSSLFSPLVDLTAAVSCNICVGCVQGEACVAPVDVNAEVYNRGVDSMWQKLVDVCEADPVDGGVTATPASGGGVSRHLSLSIDQLHSSQAPDRSVSVPLSPSPACAHHGAHGHASHHNPDAVAERRGTYSSRRERGSASGSTRSRRSNAAPGESDKRRGSPRHDKSSAGSSRRRSRTSFDSKHALREARDQSSAHVHEGDHVRVSHASGAHLSPSVCGRHMSDAGPHRSASSVDEQRQPALSGAVPKSATSSASARAAGSGALKHEGEALGRSESAASIESDVNKQVEPRAAGRMVRPPSAESHSSSRARRLQSGDSSVGHRGASSPMTSGGNIESQLMITRNHQLLKHIGKPWRAVGPGRTDKRSDESRASPGPPKPLFPPALVDDGELVVIAGDEPCLMPASPDALVSIGSAVGSDGHASRHVHSRTGGSLSDEDGVQVVPRTGSSRGNPSGGGQLDGAHRSSRSLLRSESSRDQRSRGHSSRGHSPACQSRYSRHQSSQERSGPLYGAQRPSMPDGHRSSRSGRHERRPSGYRTRSPHGDGTSRGSARLELRRSSRRESPVRSSRRVSSGRSSRRGSPSRNSRRRSPGGSSRHGSARAGGSSHRSSRRRSPDTSSRRERSRSYSRKGSPRRSSRRDSPCRLSCCETPRHNTRGLGTSKSSRHGSPALCRREHTSSGHHGSRGSASYRRDGSFSSSSRRRELGGGDYSGRDGAHERRESASEGPLSSAPALVLASSRRDEISSESSSRSSRSGSELVPRSPGAPANRADAAREWVADSSPSRGGPAAAVRATRKPSPSAVDESVGRPTAVAGSLEGSTVTSVTGSSSVGTVEVSRLRGLKGVTSRLLAKAPLQLGPGRSRRGTEFNSLLSPRATMEKLVLVLRGIPAVQAADAVETSSDTYQVLVRVLVAAPGRGGSDLLQVTVTVFRREPGGLTVASFRRSKGRQDADAFKAWYAVAYDAFCSWDERSAEVRPSGGGGVRTGGSS